MKLVLYTENGKGVEIERWKMAHTTSGRVIFDPLKAMNCNEPPPHLNVVMAVDTANSKVEQFVRTSATTTSLFCFIIIDRQDKEHAPQKVNLLDMLQGYIEKT